ncbi:lytic transglycosylase domain-containing protein [Paraburkholderia phymatum]|uniref:lytic transglycosylase domain-containing protein n=1 Tax=Paraburkholderia phymatum TaxID=148447 RepID=UPI003179601A
MAAENKSGVLVVNVDTSQFDDFVKKWQDYQQEAEKATNPFAGAAKGFNDAAQAAAAINEQMAHITQAVSTSKMTGPQSFIFLFNHYSTESAKQWKEIDKHASNTNRSFLSITRNWFNTASLRKDALKLGGLAAAAGGAVTNAANDLSKKNLESRQLGLPIGKVAAFEADYQPLGLSKADLNNFANARSDTRLWKGLLSSGIPMQEIRTAAPDELLLDAVRRMGLQFKDWESQGLPAVQIAEARGYPFGPETLRAAGSWSDQQWQATREKYLADQRAMGVDQKTADQSTAFMQKLRGDLSKFGTAFNTQLSKATPQLGHFADAVTDAGIKLANWAGPKVAKVLDEGANVIDTVNSGTTFKSPEQGGPAYKQNDAVSGFRMVGDWIRSKFPSIPDATMPGVTQPNANDTPDITQFKRWASLAESRYRLPAGVQSVQMEVESRFNPRAVNPASGAQGLMQFMPATAKGMGIDPLNPQQSIDAGGRLLRELIDKFGSLAKGLAAYDGDTHIRADGSQWLMKAKQETLNYLRPFLDKGFDLGLSPEESAYLRSHSKAFAGAKNDANLKLDQSTLDKGEQFVDMSQAGKPTPDQTAHAVEMGVVSGMDKFVSRLESVFREGGGSQFRTPERKNLPSNAQAPVNVNVNVRSVPGASTNVTIGSLPH